MKKSVMINEDTYDYFLYTSSVKEGLQDLLDDFDNDIVDDNEFLGEIREMLKQEYNENVKESD